MTGTEPSTNETALQILIANPRGFCAGVDRAIQIVELALERYGAPVYVRHEIVHNRYVVDALKEKGAIFVEELDEIPDGVPVIFSAHGVPKSVPAEAERRALLYVDATCPLVSKVHRQAERLIEQGRHILFIGHAGHPEVIGTFGQVPAGRMTLIETVEDVAAVRVEDADNLAFLTQTTLSVDDTAAIVAALERRFPSIQAPRGEDICYATSNRQEAVKALAAQADVVLVIGAPNSSNSLRLVEVAERCGARAVLVQRAAELDPAHCRRRGQHRHHRRRVGARSAGAGADRVSGGGACGRDAVRDDGAGKRHLQAAAHPDPRGLMAVYTRVPAESLTRFLKRYDVGRALSAKGIAEGVENSNYMVETTRGRFILTLYERRVDADDLPYFLGLTAHLAAKGQPVPAPIAARDGSVLQRLEGRPACLIEFLPGLSVNSPTPKLAFAAGKALAVLHDGAADYAPQRRNALSLSGWKQLADTLGKDLAEIDSGLPSLVAGECARLEAEWPRDLPGGTIHADLFPDNVLVSGERVTGIIDFYFAATDLLAYDLAIAHAAWCFDDEGAYLGDALADALIAGYESIRPLSTAERDAFPLLCRGAALRFLLTRAHDWLHTPAGALVTRKDPMAFARRLLHYRAR